MHLLDVNFWLALAFQSHSHHVTANTWMQSAVQHSCCMCRVTQMGFLRLATNRKVLPLFAVSMEEAWRAYDEILGDSRVVFVEEPPSIDVTWRSMTQGSTFSTNVWSDAYLAAFAKTLNLEVVTFDQGFVQFPGLRYVILE